MNAGETLQQSAPLTIGNAGSVGLDWTASESSLWLSLSAPNGSIPDGGDPSSLTLYADPTGLIPGLTYSTQVTIVKPASRDSPEQSVTIPVSLSVHRG